MNSAAFWSTRGRGWQASCSHRPRSHSKGTGRPVRDPRAPFSRVLREPLHSPTGTQDPTAPPFPVGRHRALTGLLGKDALRWVHPLFPPPGSRQGGGPRRLRVPGTKSPGPAPSAAPRLVFLACGTARSGRREATPESVTFGPQVLAAHRSRFLESSEAQRGCSSSQVTAPSSPLPPGAMPGVRGTGWGAGPASPFFPRVD